MTRTRVQVFCKGFYIDARATGGEAMTVVDIRAADGSIDRSLLLHARLINKRLMIIYFGGVNSGAAGQLRVRLTKNFRDAARNPDFAGQVRIIWEGFASFEVTEGEKSL